jgi:hypothetical protein
VIFKLQAFSSHFLSQDPPKSLATLCIFNVNLLLSAFSILKVMLKAKIVQILFSQIHQNYAKYTFEIFTVDRIIIAYQIESIT